MKILLIVITVMFSLSTYAKENNAFYSMIAKCTGWPHEAGVGTMEVYSHFRHINEKSVLIRTNPETNQELSIFLSEAKADNAYSDKQVTIWRDEDPQNLSSAIRIVIKKGKNLKTPYYIKGKFIKNLICDSHF